MRPSASPRRANLRPLRMPCREPVARIDQAKGRHSWSVGMANPVKLPDLRIEPEFKSATIEPKSANTGDLVQWTSGGIDQFETPRRVQSVHRRDGKEWAFVQGTNTGVPLSELTVVPPKSGVPAPP